MKKIFFSALIALVQSSDPLVLEQSSARSGTQSDFSILPVTLPEEYNFKNLSNMIESEGGLLQKAWAFNDGGQLQMFAIENISEGELIAFVP